MTTPREALRLVAIIKANLDKAIQRIEGKTGVPYWVEKYFRSHRAAYTVIEKALFEYGKLKREQRRYTAIARMEIREELINSGKIDYDLINELLGQPSSYERLEYRKGKKELSIIDDEDNTKR